MSFSKANTEKALDDLLLKMAEMFEHDDLTVEQYCRIAEVIVKIAELRGDADRRRSLDAVTNRLMSDLRIKH